MKRATLSAGAFALFIACGRSESRQATVAGYSDTPARFSAVNAPALRSMSARQEQAQGPVATDVVLPPPVEPAQRVIRMDVAGRMLIRNGEMTVRVDSLDRALQRLLEVATAVGAVVSGSTSETGDGEHRSASTELRIRSEEFERAIEALRRVGVVEAVHVTTEDVGEEFVDVGARIANGRRLEVRLLNLLSTRTGKLSDVVAIEHELASVRGGIESLEGRQRYLQAHAAMSTLTVTLHEPVTVVGYAGPGVMQQAFEASWENSVSLVSLLIRSLGLVIPLAALATTAWMIKRRFMPTMSGSSWLGLRRTAPAVPHS